MSNGISISGIKEIDQVLRGLPQQLTHQILGTAHADAAKPLISLASQKAPFRTGNLSRSIGAKKSNLKKVGILGLVQVGPLRGGNKKGYHGHLIEYGHRLVKRGRQIGYVIGKPFMEPSFNQTKNQIESNIAESLGKIVLRYMNRVIKKYA
jgi:hypothetical protein